MAIFIDENTKLVVQGITGRDGSFHTTQMIEYGTQVVAGVTPGKAGQSFAGPKGEQVPIFNSMDAAVAATGANTSVIYVPPAFAGGAIMEAADAGIEVIVAITEGVPVLDMAKVHAFARDKGARVLGPNCPGLISPGKCKVGILPGQIVTQGPVGVISRSLVPLLPLVHKTTTTSVPNSLIHLPRVPPQPPSQSSGWGVMINAL